VLAPAGGEEGSVKIPRDDTRYDLTLSHLGGLEPGQRKPLPPWPDEDAGIL
jgi:hypothetical protein